MYRAVLRWFYGPARLGHHTAEASKALLLVRTDQIGDFVLFTPGLRHIRQASPGHRITLVVNEQACDLALTCPYVDEVIPCNVRRYRRNLLYRIAFLRKLQRRGFAIAVHPVSARTPEGDEITCCSGAAERIGVLGDLNNISKPLQAKNNHDYTRLVPIEEGVSLEIERNRIFIEQLTQKNIDTKDFLPQLWITGADRSAARSLLTAAGNHLEQGPLVALLPGALWTGRAWPAERFALLADRIAETYKAKVVICGSASEEPLASAVAARMKFPAVNLAGKTRLRQLAALFELCTLLISNETGPLHIAAAVGTPTLCIIGGGHFGRFYPYGDLNKHRMVFRKLDCYHCNWKCIYETTRCIEEIRWEDAWCATQRLIEDCVLLGETARVMGEAKAAELRRCGR